MVKLSISNNTIKISPPPPGISNLLSFSYRYRSKVKKSYYNRAQKKLVETLVDGPVRTQVVPLFEECNKTNSIYTYYGMLKRVEDFLKESGVEYEIENKNNDVVPIIEDWVFDGLHEEQKEAATKMLLHPGGCMLEAATSAGKTHVIAAICRAYTGHDGLIVTNRQSVASRLYDSLSELCPKSKIGIYTTSRKIQGDTMIITAATLDSYDPEGVSYILYDECHGAAGESRSESLLRFNKAARYGLSATIHNNFNNIHNYLEAIFGPIVYSISDQEIEDLGRASPLNVYVLSVNSGPEYDHKTADLTMERHGIWYNRERNGLIKECCDRAPEDQQLVVFVRTKYHLDHLKKMYLKDFEIYHGKLSIKEKRHMLERFNSGEAKRIISTDSLSEGVDPKSLFITINANWMQSNVSVVQKAGRNRRLAEGKEFGVVIDFNDKWNPRYERKSKNKLQKYEGRGYNIFEDCTPSSIKFCEPE
jgi:superfamily II DNA or RNA helicase